MGQGVVVREQVKEKLDEIVSRTKAILVQLSQDEAAEFIETLKLRLQ